MTRQYIGNRYTPLFCGDWDITKNTTYENMSVVSYQGNSYISKVAIPKGIDITNTQYWMKAFDYNVQLEIYRGQVADYIEQMVTTQNQMVDFTNRVSVMQSTVGQMIQLNVKDYPSVDVALTHITDNTLVFFPPGIYADVQNVATIQNVNNVKFVGFGAEIKCKVLKNDGTLGSQYATPFNFINCTNITFEGLKINGGFTGTPIQIYDSAYSKLVKASGVDGLKFKDVTFSGHSTNRTNGTPSYDAGILITGSNNVVFSDCKYKDNYMEGIWIESCTNVKIDNLQATNLNGWTILDIFKCKYVNIINCNSLARNGIYDDTATLNIYSSDIKIDKSSFSGGSGIDFSDENNYCGTTESNIKVSETYINGKYGFHISGDKYVNNVIIDKCKIDANYGFYYYMYQNRHINSLRVSKTLFNVINALRVRCLGQTPIFENVYFNENTIYCKNLSDSIAFDGTLSSINGGSSAFVITGTNGATSGTEIVRDIHFIDNEIHSEGSYVYVSTPTAYVIKDIEFRGNKCFNHDYNLTVLNERGVYANGVTRFVCKDNEIHNTKNNNIGGCTDLFIESNEVIFDGATQSTRIWYLYSNTGSFIGRDNFCNSAVMEHFQGNGSFLNTWTAYILRDNLPATYTSITAN